jgi:hypothetical protein
MIFSHSGGEVTLVSRKRVEMTLPATVAEADESANPEFFAEVRGADGRPLHRAAVANPLQNHREVFSDDPERSIHRVPVEEPQGVFTVVVPDHPQGDHVALMMARPAAATDAESASDAARRAGFVPGEDVREIARVPMRDPDGTGDEL